MSEQAADDKPFKCTSCEQRFANSDHLLVHKKMHQQQGLQVKMPLSVSADSLADQTPTPTRFLKTADVEGSQLFEEINPFDQYFKIASSVSSVSSTSSILQTPTSTLPIASSNEVSSSTLSSEMIIKVEKSPVSPRKEASATLDKVSGVNVAPSKVVIIKAPKSTAQPVVLSPKLPIKRQAEIAPLPVQPKKIKSDHINDVRIKSVTSANDVNTKASSATSIQPTAQELIKEQLTALINSGQLKIQFSTDSSSSNIQAVIVGNSPKSTAITSEASSYIETSVTQSLFSQFPPQPIKSVITNTPSILSTHGQSTNPTMSIIGAGSPVVCANNLDLVKQRLKESIQSSDNNNIVSPRASMVQAGSNQGKYKDIILSDEFTQNLLTEDTPGSRRKRDSIDEQSTPDEKRRKFLERNRAAASRCRQKRKIWVNQLEKKSEDLQNTNTQLMNEITTLRAEVAQLKALLIAHKDCPVTLQHKALLGQIGSSAASYVAMSGGQLIAIHEVPTTSGASGHPTSAEEVATSALTDMATGRTTVELANHVSTGTVTVQTSDGPLPAISTTMIS